MKLDTAKQIWIIIILCFATRIPQLISPNLLLDGDECVVAIMAKHIMQLKGFPLFFYGQNYGFSLLEALFIIPFYWLLGVTTLAVKIGMLALWTTGVLFFYKLLKAIGSSNEWLAFAITLLLVLTPAWAVWSMKARGGYLTAFTLTSVLLYLLFHKKQSQKPGTYIICGLLIIVIYQSQSLWIFCTAATGLYAFFKSFSFKNFIVFALSILVFNVAFNFLREGVILYYLPEIAPPTFDNVLHRLYRIPAYIYNNIQGHYFFKNIQQHDIYSAVFACIFTTISLALPVIAAILLIGRRWKYLSFIFSAAGILPLLAATMWRPGMEPRYLLPITGCVLMSLFFLLKNWKFKYRHAIAIPYTFLIILGCIALPSFYSFSFSPYTAGTLRQMINYLEQRDVRHAFCYNGMVCWQIIFYSDEQLLCRENTAAGRHQPYYLAINQAYSKGQKTAFISESSDFGGLQFGQIENYNGFYLSFDPPENELIKTFRF